MMNIIKHIRTCIYKRTVIKYLILAVIAGSITVVVSNRINAEEIIESYKTSSLEVCNNSIRINNLIFTVNNVSESKSNQYKTASEGNKLVCVNLKVTNDSTTQEQLTSIMMFKLYDKNGNIYNIVLPEGPDSINGLLSSDESKDGTVWFEVPKGINSFDLYIRPSMMSQETGILDIEIGEPYYTNNNEIVSNSNENEEHIIKESDLDPKSNITNITIDSLVFNIKEVLVSERNKFGAAGEGNYFLDINLSVRNDGSKEEQITSHMIFKLVDMDNQVYNIVLPEENGINGILKPQKEISGKISFRVKEEKRKFKLEIKPWVMKELKEYVNIDV